MSHEQNSANLEVLWESVPADDPFRISVAWDPANSNVVLTGGASMHADEDGMWGVRFHNPDGNVEPLSDNHQTAVAEAGVLIADSKDMSLPPICVGKSAYQQFLEAIKDGKLRILDDLISAPPHDGQPT